MTACITSPDDVQFALTYCTTLIHSNDTSAEINSLLLLKRVRTIIKFYIWPLVALFGITGNCLSIIVLTRQRLIRTTTNNYLTALALFDSGYLIFTTILNLGSHPYFENVDLMSILLYLIKPLADCSSNTAVWLIVCFTLERTLAVAKPMYARTLCTIRRTRMAITIVLFSSFLVTLPTFFETKLVRDTPDHLRMNNSTIKKQPHLRIQYKELFNNSLIHRIYVVFICVLIVWLPLLLLCLCNSILIWYVHRFKNYDDFCQANGSTNDENNRHPSILTNKNDYNNRKFSLSSLASSSNSTIQLRRHSRSFVQKRKVTIILIFCLSVAVLLWTPQSLSLTYEIVVQRSSNMTREERILLLIFNNFANLFLCINASIDFILYCFLSDKFARTCKQIICRQCSSHRQLLKHRNRMLSLDRTSLNRGDTCAKIKSQRQQSSNSINNYYLQLYTLYEIGSNLSHQTSHHHRVPRATTMSSLNKNERKIIYRTSATLDKKLLPTSLLKRTFQKKDISLNDSRKLKSNRLLVTQIIDCERTCATLIDKDDGEILRKLCQTIEEKQIPIKQISKHCRSLSLMNIGHTSHHLDTVIAPLRRYRSSGIGVFQ
ncbi:unnamed protein product [Didymodactylos carnosus]|uniref:G-protein coupled receptors family 1 profile domain-containing protein n=1 Tax=Didymodactylos carnosus TaxID=1234261 RepID=A0A814B4K5_9BILA|nr:unnamed protein product [Didymodactylos carnosus]CAF3702170.1 unnamed protein product [Didymodactylos carnosus]